MTAAAKGRAAARRDPAKRSGRPPRRAWPDHEARLYLAAHPFAYPLLRLLARLGPAVRVPGLGVVVNDAATARAVLMDARFRKDGPGSPGDLWTPVLGPSVLLNMEGEGHLALRRRLSPLFTPAYTRGLVADVLRGPLAGLDRRLGAGETVDLVDVMRVMAGAVICRVIGLGEVDEQAARELFEEGERVVAMVSLRSRRLSDRQIAAAREVLDRIGEVATAAYHRGEESTVMGRMRALGLSEAEARGAAGAFFLTGTETVATFVPRFIALLHDHGVLHTLTGTDVRHRVEHPSGGAGVPDRTRSPDDAAGWNALDGANVVDDAAGPNALDDRGAMDDADEVAGPDRAREEGDAYDGDAGDRIGADQAIDAIRLDAAIEEAMRVTTPTPVMLRSVSAPAEVGRVRVSPGDRVVIVTHNCCRAYGPFDLSLRHPPELRRLWFGAGPHFCIGYPLALAEIRAVAEVVLRHSPRIVGRKAARGVLIPTYRHLWIRAAR